MELNSQKDHKEFKYKHWNTRIELNLKTINLKTEYKQ